MGEINTKQIIGIITSQWKKLTIVAILAIIISSFISSPLFIKPKYKSTAVIYPINLEPFSQESNTEQLLQFLNSEEIKNNLAKRFDLYKRYGINMAEEKAVSKFNDFYNSNIKISNTLYESIEIDIMDESPLFAQTLCSAIIQESDKLITRLKREKVDEYMKSFTRQLNIKQHEVDSLEAKLKYMRMTYGLLDFNAQTKVISKRMGKGPLSEDEKLLLKGLKEYGGEYILLQNKLLVEIESYKNLKLTYDKNRLDFEGNLSYSSVVSKPNLPDKKCYPLRLVIVLLFTFSTLLLAVVIILVTDKKRN